MPFKCLHSGKCCEKEYTQVNLTLGDIKRIAAFLKLEPKDLFWHYVGMQPFQQPSNLNVYDYELGLEIPCRFRQNGRCTIYPARPLNCRMFPYWIIAEVPRSKWIEALDGSYECVHKAEISDEDIAACKEYVEKVGKVLLSEAEETDKLIDNLKMKRSIDLSWFKSAEVLANVPQSSSVLSTTERQKRIDEEKIRMCKRVMDKKVYKGLPEAVGDATQNIKTLSSEELNEWEITSVS